MATTLAEVLRRFGPEYLSRHTLSSAQARAWRAIVACRTAALGGERLRCDGCHAEHWRWHSCRNRHCPQCQSRSRDAWRAARLSELLTVPYCHLVFTLPHELNALAGTHARWVYDTLMHEAAATLTEFAANPRWLGGTPAFTLVLHTWTQDLRRHLHVHALMACGALRQGEDGASSWVTPARGERFLFPVHALSRVFRGRFMAALQAAEAAGELPRDPADARERRERRAALWRHDWVVYAKTPLAGPAAVLDYLSRYTHRTAIGHERLVDIDGDSVRLRVRADDHGDKRVISMPGEQFIGRLLQHVLPGGFKRIRHYGLLAPCAKTERLRQARRLLAMPATNPQAREQAEDFMRRVAVIEINTCPHCHGTWRVVEQRGADVQALRGLLPVRQASCRGPP
ncbi:IS91 family transposase [Roseateles caseinilyticus]|uniref:IS91 family transposase n=1 Tax=Pelomonas caseinilytica TaxID=2906763 RepID=UPI002101EC95|nr:IS91 family transposase [Pelomonas sp. P7]